MKSVVEFIDDYFIYIFSILLLIGALITMNFVLYFNITFQVIGVTLDITDLIIYILIGSISFRAFTVSKRTMFHTALIDVQGEYGTPEIGSAIRSLWDLYDKTLEKLEYSNNKSLTKNNMKRLTIHIQDEFERIYKKMEVEIKKTENWGEKLEIYKKSFDNQRRIISHYYSHLYDLINIGIIERKRLYDGWGKYHLDTVELISIPLEEKLKDIIGKKRPKIGGRIEVKDENLNKLEKLLEDFKNYKNKKKS